MTEPREWTQDDIDHDMGLDDICPNCGGEGFVSSCFEEWACVDPDSGCDLCTRRCDWCNPRKPKQTTADVKAPSLPPAHHASPENTESGQS